MQVRRDRQTAVEDAVTVGAEIGCEANAVCPTYVAHLRLAASRSLVFGRMVVDAVSVELVSSYGQKMGDAA